MAEVNEQWVDKLKWARTELLALRKQYPQERLLLSAITQLEYLIALEEGIESDKSSLEIVDIGYLAVYPLADIVSHDLSVALCDISQKIKRDLRRQGRKSQPNQDKGK